MKTVDKMDILHSQTPEFIAKGERGKFLKLIPDTFIIKGEENKDGSHQGYAIRHLNRKDIILIDVVEKGMQDAVKKLVTDGYTIKGIIITNSKVYKNTYADLKDISQDAGKAPVYSHPLLSVKDNFNLKDITKPNEIHKNFGLKIINLPGGDGGGSVLVYSDINEGMLFTGASAEGSPYDSDKNNFTRPKLGSKNDDFGLAEGWAVFTRPFRYMFPLKGKPGFNLTDSQQKQIISELSKIEE